MFNAIPMTLPNAHKNTPNFQQKSKQLQDKLAATVEQGHNLKKKLSASLDRKKMAEIIKKISS